MAEASSVKLIERIYNACEVLKNCEFNIPEDDKDAYENFAELDKYFKTSGKETWILCAFILNYLENGDTIKIEKIASYFNIPVMKLLLNKDDIFSLLKKKYIYNPGMDKNESIKNLTGETLNNLILKHEVLDCILNETELKLAEAEDEVVEHNAIEFVSEIQSRTDDYSNSFFSSLSEHLENMEKCENQFEELDFVKECRSLIKSSSLRYLFYDVCGDFLKGGRDCSNLNATIEDFFSPTTRMSIARDFMEEKNVLFKEGLITFTKKSNLTDASIEPTLKAQKMFLGDSIDMFQKKTEGTNVIQPKSIKKKELFYSPSNKQEIERIFSSLSKSNFKKIQTRLNKENLPTGVAVLLYGAAGTGKTETVYQLAKKTGRAVYHVDIAASKSAWFGESEKIIKKTFDQYNAVREMSIKQGQPCPILLFNEADAIFKKRSDNTDHSTDQTLNAMQNIILEEMERFQGILIATTNLASNFDSAFERRFLFKVQFDRPTTEAKKSIWMSKLKWLNEKDAESFASEFDLSGGEIDNICRKLTMDEIITGIRPDPSSIKTFCQNERLDKSQHSSIGFAI